MINIGKTRKFLSMTFAALAITAGFLAGASPSFARTDCGWTPRGTVCHYVP